MLIRRINVNHISTFIEHSPISFWLVQNVDNLTRMLAVFLFVNQHFQIILYAQLAILIWSSLHNTPFNFYISEMVNYNYFSVHSSLLQLFIIPLGHILALLHRYNASKIIINVFAIHNTHRAVRYLCDGRSVQRKHMFNFRMKTNYRWWRHWIPHPFQSNGETVWLSCLQIYTLYAWMCRRTAQQIHYA